MKLKVKEVAERLGIKNAKQLRDVTGLGMGTCYQLWDCTARGIQFDTLNTLCNKLQAGPALFFEFTPDVEPQEDEPTPATNKRESRRPSLRGSKSENRKMRSAVVDSMA